MMIPVQRIVGSECITAVEMCVAMVDRLESWVSGDVPLRNWHTVRLSPKLLKFDLARTTERVNFVR